MFALRPASLLCLVVSTLAFVPPLAAQTAVGEAQIASGSPFECGSDVVEAGLEQYLARVASGEIVPATPPEVAPRSVFPADGAPSWDVVEPQDIWAYEDSASLLASDFDYEQVVGLMVEASNEFLATFGDNFDFIGFWMTYPPATSLGTSSFYQRVENDVEGIGKIGTRETFDLRPELGLAGENVEGMLMLWDIDSEFWVEGDAVDAEVTRLLLGHEFTHRFGVYLQPLLDGRELQGNDKSCGRPNHWNWQIDGQGSTMEISEWVGTDPAVFTLNFLNWNQDILGGYLSFTDLYVMGYVPPEVMDLGNSELRFMDQSYCHLFYDGPISTFTSEDVIAANGPRVPNSDDAQKSFRCGWIMLHLPGAPPTAAQRQKAANILNQQSSDWNFSTLGLGAIDHTLPGIGSFEDLGGGVAGFFGFVPTLTASGLLVAGETVTLQLTNARFNAPATLVVGTEFLGAPFKGGVLVPEPTLLFGGLTTDLGGSITLQVEWPDGLAPGSELYLQYWIDDASGPEGYAASNALGAFTD